MAVYGTERRGASQSAEKCHFTMKMTVFAFSQIYSIQLHFLFLQAHSELMKPSSDLLPLQKPNNMQ